MLLYQKCCPAVEIGSQQVDAALGIRPVPDHHEFQFFVQELFGRSFKLRIHFNEVRQHAHWLESMRSDRAQSP